MRCILVVLASICATVSSLKLSRQPDKEILPQSAKNNILNSKVVSNYTCADAECSLNKTSTLKTSKLVWFIGSSIDSQAVTAACTNAHAVIMPTPGNMTDQSFKYCVLHGLNLVFTFHPGATPPPYYNLAFGYKGAVNTPEIITSSVQQIQQIFGKSPDVAILDSSIWDAANWWIKAGAPQQWPVPHQDIQKWCHATIPNFLVLVQSVIPHARVAFRTPPPVFSTCYNEFWFMCRGPEVISEMYGCLLSQMHGGTLLYGTYPVIDYHKIVLAKQQALGGPAQLRGWYLNELHPGSVLALEYITEVLTWVNGM